MKETEAKLTPTTFLPLLALPHLPSKLQPHWVYFFSECHAHTWSKVILFLFFLSQICFHWNTLKWHLNIVHLTHDILIKVLNDSLIKGIFTLPFQSYITPLFVFLLVYFMGKIFHWPVSSYWPTHTKMRTLWGQLSWIFHP